MRSYAYYITRQTTRNSCRQHNEEQQAAMNSLARDKYSPCSTLVMSQCHPDPAPFEPKSSAELKTIWAILFTWPADQLIIGSNVESIAKYICWVEIVGYVI